MSVDALCNRLSGALCLSYAGEDDRWQGQHPMPAFSFTLPTAAADE